MPHLEIWACISRRHPVAGRAIASFCCRIKYHQHGTDARHAALGGDQSTPSSPIGDATCSQQLDTLGIVAQGIAAGTDIAGLGAEIAAQAAGVGPTQQAAEAAALGIQVVSKTASAVAYGAQVQQTMLPSCEQTFTGTVTVTNGGVNVTGGSIFNGNVGVVGSLNASQNVTASQVHATQGISADGGAIWLGDPNGTTFSSGITLGGGALSGAGTGGPQAFTGDVTSIAIGNGASAFSVNSTAIGTNARAGAVGGGGLTPRRSATIRARLLRIPRRSVTTRLQSAPISRCSERPRTPTRCLALPRRQAEAPSQVCCNCRPRI